MQFTNFIKPSLRIPREEIEKTIGITKFNFLEFDNFKSKIFASQIPHDCTNLIKLRDTGMMHTMFTCISYTDDKLTENISHFFKKENNEYVIGPHKDGNNVREGFNTYAASLVFPLIGINDDKNYSKVEWYKDHPDQIVFNERTGTWIKNPEILEKTQEAFMIENEPIILRTDQWHGIRFSSTPRVLMRWLFCHDLTWGDILNYFD